MAADKEFLTYNQQMKKLRDKKKIDCGNTKDKTTLVRMGYFNLVNGYKEPFICGKDNNGNHIYIANTSLKALYALKKFDDDLRMLLLKYITQIEEEVRTLNLINVMIMERLLGMTQKHILTIVNYKIR